MLVTRQLRFSYTAEKTFLFPDIHCAAGKTLIITGSSGKGKTTFLHLLAGLLKPTAGQVMIDDTDLTSLNEKKRDHFRGQHIGIVFQQSHFVQSLSVMENLALAARLSGNHIDPKQAAALLEQLNVAEQTHQKTYKLSQGQQQRVSIARALINSPALLLADEPTSSLDDDNCIQVAQLLLQQSKQSDAALVIVTHDQRLKDIFQRSISLS